MSFFLEMLADGLLSGVMYALVTIGFVLIFKASDVFNYAREEGIVPCAEDTAETAAG